MPCGVMVTLQTLILAFEVRALTRQVAGIAHR